jgi:hypothetical protein
MSFHPTTPQSPSQVSIPTPSDTVHPLASSMSQATTLPTPAHSVNGSTSQQDVAMIDETPNKRKRALDDDGDRDSKKIHLGDQRLDIDDLHIDVGEKYLLCQIRKTPLHCPLPLLSWSWISTVVGKLGVRMMFLLT